LRKITPGLIVLAGVLAKYLVLPDKEFRKVGDKSKVNYAQEYRSFKQFIQG